MFIKLFVISLVISVLVFLALGIKLLLDPKAEFSLHDSFEADKGATNKDKGCSQCQIKDLANCQDGEINVIKT